MGIVLGASKKNFTGKEEESDMEGRMAIQEEESDVEERMKIQEEESDVEGRMTIQV